MKINWKVRIKNVNFWVQVFLAVFTPILAYAGLTTEELTSWRTVGELLLGAISNPYVLSLVVVSVYNAITDPTTAGIFDSTQALSYNKPKRSE